MCSYGSFSKHATAPKRDPNAPTIEKKLTTYEKRHGVSLKKKDVQFIKMCEDGLVDSIRDRVNGHPEMRPTHVDVCVRSGSRSQGNRITTALHAASKNGHAETCRVLLELGANPSKRLELGRILCPIHVASNAAVCHVLLDHGSIARSNDPRVPDPAWYHRTQNREEIAAAIDEYNLIQKNKRQKRVNARANLQQIWQRLIGMVVGLRRIRRFQKEYKEKFYCPDSGKYIEIGNKRFYKMYNYTGSDINKTIISERKEYVKIEPAPSIDDENKSLLMKINNLENNTSDDNGDNKKISTTTTNCNDIYFCISALNKSKKKSSKNINCNNNSTEKDISQEQRERDAKDFDINKSMYNIGDRVKVRDNEIGKIRFIGPVEFAKGVWAGIELETLTGKNDGIVNGHQYFTCKKRAKKNSDKRYGLFVRYENMKRIEKSTNNIDTLMKENLKKARSIGINSKRSYVVNGGKTVNKYKTSGGSGRNAILSLRSNDDNVENQKQRSNNNNNHGGDNFKDIRGPGGGALNAIRSLK